MRRAIERLGFFGGTTLAAVDAVWALSLLAFDPPSAVGGTAFLVMVLAHGFLVWRTFQPFGGPWRAVVRPTSTRIAAARLLLALGAVFVLGSVCALVANHASHFELLVQLVLASVAFLLATYVAVHWALRPERVFSVNVVRMVSPWSLLRSRRWRG